jgi:2-hydroxy-6-oxonona-2,4-dienedioate hydrolase
VLVNGPPPLPTPRWIRTLDAVVPAPLLRALVRALSFSPPALARSFADRANVPAPLARAAAAPSPAHLDVLITLLARGCPPAARPSAPLLLLWGTADRLPDTSVAAAHALSKVLPGATLALVPAAGHCPQLEQPAAFVDALVAFAAAHGPSLQPAA